MIDTTLPPLPRSDEEALGKNIYDGFYKVKARDFWGPNQVIRESVRPDKKCPHEFKATPSGAKCTKCHFGLIGPIEVKKGKLIIQGEPVNF